MFTKQNIVFLLIFWKFSTKQALLVIKQKVSTKNKKLINLLGPKVEKDAEMRGFILKLLCFDALEICSPNISKYELLVVQYFC